MIDIDKPELYPRDITDIITNNHEILRTTYSRLKFHESWKYGRYIENADDQYSILNPMVECCKTVLKPYYLTGYHATRVLCVSEILDEGLLKTDDENTEKRLSSLFAALNFSDNEASYLMSKVNSYRNRGSDRRGTVHFYSSYELHEEYQHFAHNLGGETVDFALNNDYSRQPYTKLVSQGIPITVKFRYRYIDVAALREERIALELLKAKILPLIFQIPYIPRFDGWINASVPSYDILDIQPVENTTWA